LGRLSLTQSPCQALPHPFIEGGCLLAIGSGSGSLLLLELVGRAEPRVVLKAVTPDNAPVIGVGLQQVRCWLVSVLMHYQGFCAFVRGCWCDGIGRQ
jgi:hypothetical protein